MFEKNLEIGYLLDFYGEILPERRRDIMDLYYNDDLSLSEIAEQMGMPVSTFYTKLNGPSEFSFSEGKRLAEIIGCTVDEMFIRPSEDSWKDSTARYGEGVEFAAPNRRGSNPRREPRDTEPHVRN